MAEEAREVTLGYGLEIVGRLISEAATVPLLGQCAVHEDIDAAEFLQHLIVEPVDRHRIEEVERQTVYIVAATLHFGCELVVSLAGARGGDDGRAGFGERRRDATAEQWAGPAGDKRYAASERETVEDRHSRHT